MREYRYVREGEETLQTPLGEIATVIYRSERDELTARRRASGARPSRGYIPMRVEQKRGDDVEWTMEIQSLKRE